MKAGKTAPAYPVNSRCFQWLSTVAGFSSIRKPWLFFCLMDLKANFFVSRNAIKIAPDRPDSLRQAPTKTKCARGCTPGSGACCCSVTVVRLLPWRSRRPSDLGSFCCCTEPNSPQGSGIWTNLLRFCYKLPTKLVGCTAHMQCILLIRVIQLPRKILKLVSPLEVYELRKRSRRHKIEWSSKPPTAYKLVKIIDRNLGHCTVTAGHFDCLSTWLQDILIACVVDILITTSSPRSKV